MGPKNTGLRIGEVAAAAGLAASAIRYYERVGLLEPAGRAGGKRRYGRDVISRLAIIQMTKEVGFTLAEIKTLVDGISNEGRPNRTLQSLARRKLAEVEATLRRAQLVKRILQAAERCECPSFEDCCAIAEKVGFVPRRALNQRLGPSR